MGLPQGRNNQLGQVTLVSIFLCTYSGVIVGVTRLSANKLASPRQPSTSRSSGTSPGSPLFLISSQMGAQLPYFIDEYRHRGLQGGAEVRRVHNQRGPVTSATRGRGWSTSGPTCTSWWEWPCCCWSGSGSIPGQGRATGSIQPLRTDLAGGPSPPWGGGQSPRGGRIPRVLAIPVRIHCDAIPSHRDGGPDQTSESDSLLVPFDAEPSPW